MTDISVLVARQVEQRFTTRQIIARAEQAQNGEDQ